jgi:hypothetical protein
MKAFHERATVDPRKAKTKIIKMRSGAFGA